MSWVTWVLIGYLIGLFVGWVIGSVHHYKKERPIGTIEIDKGEDSNIYRLVWFEDPDKIDAERQVIFEVNPYAKLREESNDYND